MIKLFLFVFLMLGCFSGNAQNYSSARIINADSLGNKPVPFDVPFDLYTQKISDLKRVYAVRVFDALPIHEKPYKVSLSHFDRPFDTTGKTLVVHVFPIKPKKVFNVAIQSRLSDESLQMFIDLVDKLNSVDTVGSYDFLVKIITKLTDKTNRIQTIPYTTVEEFQESDIYIPIVKVLKSSIDNNTSIKLLNLDEASEAVFKTKIRIDRLTLYRLCNADYNQNISSGVNDINNINVVDNECKKSDIFQRIKNIKTTLNAMQKLVDSIEVVYITNKQLPTKFVLNTLNKDLQTLNSNEKILQDCANQISEIFIKDNKVTEAVWINANSKSQDIETASASVLSTDFGFSTILVKDINNEYQTIPRLYLGVNFFFRPVDRNVGSRYREKHREKKADKHNKINNDLITRPNLFYHLNFTVGFTLGGALNTPGFSNLVTDNLCVEMGPSYRFLQAFRISAGLALLNRNNPNPLIENNKLYPGAYASLSIDLAFAKSAKLLTDFFAKFP